MEVVAAVTAKHLIIIIQFLIPLFTAIVAKDAMTEKEVFVDLGFELAKNSLMSRFDLVVLQVTKVLRFPLNKI